MVKISRLSLVRRKSVYKTAAAAWKDIQSKINIKSSQVRASHSKKGLDVDTKKEQWF